MPESSSPEEPRQSPGDAFPEVPYRVLYAGIPFFADPACQERVEDATIAILEPLDPDGDFDTDVVPTRRQYQPGQLVCWTAEKDNVWEDSWYRNPETGQVEQAWTLHVEFTGEPISQETIDRNRERLEQLETRMSEKSRPQ